MAYNMTETYVQIRSHFSVQAKRKSIIFSKILVNGGRNCSQQRKWRISNWLVCFNPILPGGEVPAPISTFENFLDI